MFRGFALPQAGFPQEINFQNINQLSWAIDQDFACLWRKMEYLSWNKESKWKYIVIRRYFGNHTHRESLVETPLREGIISECFEYQSVSGVSGSIRLTSNWQHWLCSWWLPVFVYYISRLGKPFKSKSKQAWPQPLLTKSSVLAAKKQTSKTMAGPGKQGCKIH